MSYIRNELCRLRRRSDEYIELTQISWRMKNIYLLTKSVEDVQLSAIKSTRTLILFARFIWQNVRIEANQYIAIAAVTVYDEMLGGLQ
jgi:hypothetical protein